MRTPEESVRPAPRVLSIAGSDPSGGAGIHADLKSIAANGGYGMAAITALTAQSTRGVRAVHVPPVDVLVAQLDALSDDIEIDAVKIGMLANAEVTRAVDAWLARAGAPVVVVDPVMVATSGDRLLDDDAVSALRDLLRRADVVTPNIPELAVLVSEPEADTWDAVLAQAGRAAREFGVDVVAKGGHLAGADAPDALVTAAGEVREFPGARIATTNTHGTGCSFSSAIATRIAGGADRAGAVGEAKRWLAESIRHGAALRVGGGSGPVSHFAGLWARGGLETAPTPEEAAADWWAASSEAREAIDALPFVRGLGDGSLDRDAFVWYLAQDAL
ncbi:bifunctional hydroxymethylpyrimidine kinase/phosphomethylpyrimidine kinase [Microbacterium sp. gxy059]|uniref:bifunctional hydroxymethylpyrimidine kinase/phosphomethylpyrimidine kinase n=1 Tax=Microbacterium sp. gxy059 TaxID=2957199 RepID=UPI003D963525